MLNKKTIVGHLSGTFFIVLSIVTLSGPYVTGKVLRMTDTSSYLTVAYNLAVHKHYGEGLDDQGYLRVEPTYPYYLAGIFLFSNDFSTVSLECLDYRDVATKCSSINEKERAHKVRLLVNKISFSIIILLVVIVTYASKLVSNSWRVGYLSGVFMVIFLPHDGQELLTNIFLILHSLFLVLFLQERQKKYIYAMCSGIFLGVLVLSGPIFLYYLYMIITAMIVTAVLTKFRLIRRFGSLFIIMTLSAIVVIAPWMARNYQINHRIDIVDRGGMALAQRADSLNQDITVEHKYLNYLPRPIPEFISLFFPFSYERITSGSVNSGSAQRHSALKALTRGLIEEGIIGVDKDLYNEKEHSEIDYELWKSYVDDLILELVDTTNGNGVDLATDPNTERNRLLTKGALSFIQEKFWKHLLVTTPLNISLGSQFDRNINLKETLLTSKISYLIFALYPLLLPALGFVVVHSIREKRWETVLFIFPATFCYGFISFFMVFTPRYNHIFTSLSVFCLSFLLCTIFKKMFTLIELNRR